MNKIIVVLPARNAEKTLELTVAELSSNFSEIILVDDASEDRTVQVARSLGLTVECHPARRGYGGNLKSCFRMAIERNPDAVIVLHPDYQYDPSLIPYFIGFLEHGICDLILGSRIRSRAEALQGGMPLWKYLFNRSLTFIENLILGQNLGDAHSGFRCFTKEILETIPFAANSNDFVFDTEFLAQAVYHGFRVGDAPMPARYFKEASSIAFFKSLKYGYESILVLVKFMLAKTGIFRAKIFR